MSYNIQMTNEKQITSISIKKAFERLSQLVPLPFSLIMGGGGAMIMAHGFPLATADVDAVPKGIDISALDKYIKQIAQEQGLPSDWLNPYFSTFMHTLPNDYGDRLV